MSELVQDQAARVAPPLLQAAEPVLGLPHAQSASIQAGAWFAGLSAPLHEAILGLARVRQAQAGACIARRGDAAVSWVGVEPALTTTASMPKDWAALRAMSS